MIKEARAKVCMDHTLLQPFLLLKLGYIAGLKGIKKMLKCRSTCSMLVFVLKKTSQALDDVPEDHLHNKVSFTLLKDLTNIKDFFKLQTII